MTEPRLQVRTLPMLPIAVAASVAFLYAPVLLKLCRDWWNDENYSHGLLVPFVIAAVVWSQRSIIASAIQKPNLILGWLGVIGALLLLGTGVLGSELFTQRMSLVVMLAATVVYFVGRKTLSVLVVPFTLLLLAIPVPQIVFNRIALPLQMWASKTAAWGIRLFDIPTVRKGNVIDILPRGGIEAISLEVVEACSGIRSLMTLVTLALVLAYFTRQKDAGGFANLTRPDIVRSALLMIAAVPIAVLTNAGRVTATGIGTYLYGKQATEGTVHEASGWAVYVVALAILVGLNFGLRRLLPEGEARLSDPATYHGTNTLKLVLPLIAVLLASGIGVNWLANRTENIPPRQVLSSFPTSIDNWRQRGCDTRFTADVEKVLGTTDYVMREYTRDDGRIANIYVGYYATQRTGATYHSPQNCLPGAGWVLSEPGTVTITTPQGRTFTANRYILEHSIYREVMLYWYQGRGRTEASEFRDKLNTIWDSVTKRRSDGAMIRVMTDVGDDKAAADAAVNALAAQVADQLPPYIPE